jgi:PTH1 family peptidyl-tRNA hydrolase
MKLIAGLGNPGKEYYYNRHNIGFLSLNYFARVQRIALDKKQGKARVGIGYVAGAEIVLAKPQTFMNASGTSINQLMQKYKIAPQDLIVVHDDLDLPLGKIRIRQGSSAAGHRGIKSIIDCLGTQDFVRIRTGISRPHFPGESATETIVDYVLGDFTPEEKPVVDNTIRCVCEAIVCLLTEGLTNSMNKFNSSHSNIRI